MGRVLVGLEPDDRRAVDWAVRSVGPAVTLERVRQLSGGGARVLALDVRAGRGRRRLVLKRHVNPDWIAEEPDMAEREARVLAWLADTGVPAPRVVAVDAAGESTGTPAVLMTRVPGRHRFRRLDEGDRFRRCADVLLVLHDLRPPPGVRVARYARYVEGVDLEPPAWSPDAAAWLRAFELAATVQPVAPRFVHRDYHPENVLWLGERISGVIDWVAASLGPPHVDVAHFRANLFRTAGRREADAWVESCVAAGVVSDYDARWDLIVAIDFLPGERMTPRERRAADQLVLAGLGLR